MELFKKFILVKELLYLFKKILNLFLFYIYKKKVISIFKFFLNICRYLICFCLKSIGICSRVIVVIIRGIVRGVI